VIVNYFDNEIVCHDMCVSETERLFVIFIRKQNVVMKAGFLRNLSRPKGAVDHHISEF
jgi:hypothetical protein